MAHFVGDVRYQIWNKGLLMSVLSAMPLVSVIIPMYQAEATIERALSSVLNQTYPNWECIVVDDGSTDDSLCFTSRFVQEDPRVRVLSQVNGGRSAARNTGTAVAQGEYVSFLDADDVLVSTFLEKTVEAAERTGSGCVMTAFRRSEGNDAYTTSLSGASKLIDSVDAAKMACAFWDNKKLAPFPPYAVGTVFRSVCGKLMRLPGRSSHELPAFCEGLRFGEDLLFMLDVYEEMGSVEALDYVGYLYVDNPMSTTNGYHGGDIEAIRRLIRCLQESAGGVLDEDLLRFAAARDVLSLVASVSMCDDKQSSSAEIERAMANDEFRWACAPLRGHRVSSRWEGQLFSEAILFLLRHGMCRMALHMQWLARSSGWGFVRRPH